MFERKTEKVNQSTPLNKEAVRVAIVGAGVIGMTAAYHLSKKGYDVTLISKDDPLHTNSDVAAALWRPYGAEPQKEALLSSAQTYSEIFDIYYEYLKEKSRQDGAIHPNRNPGVSFGIDVEYFAEGQEKPAWMQDADLLLEDKIKLLEKDKESDDEHVKSAATALLAILNKEHSQVPDVLAKALPHSTRKTVYASVVPLMDATIYRKWLLNEYQRMSGKEVITDKVDSLNKDSKSLGELAENYDIILNCAGEQARNLSTEAETVPIRGLVVVTKIPEELNYSIGMEPNPDLDNGKIIISYAIRRPESGTVVMGGTYEEPSKEKSLAEYPEVSDENKKNKDAEMILSRLVHLIPGIKSISELEIISINEGFRCGRDKIYCNVELITVDGKVILLGGAYGHGGGGYSVSHGVGQQLVALCEKKLLELQEVRLQEEGPSPYKP